LLDQRSRNGKELQIDVGLVFRIKHGSLRRRGRCAEHLALGVENLPGDLDRSDRFHGEILHRSLDVEVSPGADVRSRRHVRMRARGSDLDLDLVLQLRGERCSAEHHGRNDGPHEGCFH